MSSPPFQLRSILRTLATVGLSATALAFCRYLIFVIWYKRAQMRSKLPLPPGPTPLPMLGSLLDLATDMGPDGNPLVHIALMKMSRKYPNGMFGFYLGNQYTLVIHKPQVAEEAYCEHMMESGEHGKGQFTTDRAPNQSSGGHHVPTMKIATRDGKGIAMSSGAYWRKVRGRLVAAITNTRVAERNAPMIMEEVGSVVWSWNQSCLRGEDITDLTAQLKRESMNMAMRLLFSTRWGNELPRDYQELQHIVEYVFCNLSAGNPSDMIPALRVLPNKFLTEFQNVVNRRDVLLGGIIDKHRKEFMALRAQGKMTSRSEARDILDLFFFDQYDGFDQEVDGITKVVKLTEEEVHVCIWDILFASTDTTATTNEWMIYHLINNPHIQKKVHEELERVVGMDRLPTIDDRDKLPYFHAFLFEVFRYKIVSPVMAPHYATQDTTLHDTTGKEFFIPQGTQIFMHGYAMAQDPELWDNPSEFNPDRWLTAREKGMELFGQVKRPTVEMYKFMPFSIGPRMCPGYSFAKVAQFLQAATIAHCFTFKLSDAAYKSKKVSGGKLDLTETWGLTIMPQRYGEMGLISATPRPPARLAKPLYNDIDRTKTFLNKEEQKVTLIAKQQLSHDTVLLRLGLGNKATWKTNRNRVLGLPVGKHIKVIVPNLPGKESGKWNGRDDAEAGKAQVERAYTPTSSDNDPGYLDLLVKVYAPGKVARFPDGGKMSQQLGQLQVNDELVIKGPFGLIQYMGQSVFKIGSKGEVSKKMVGMMAGGSGITPMLQILVAALEDPLDKTKFSLVYANQTEGDILCRAQLEDLEKRFPAKFRLHYTVDRAPEGGSWKYSVGFIDEQMIKDHMPPPGPDTLILGCGPPLMIEKAVKENLVKRGYDVKEMFAAF